jgi:hypothetical protein
MASRKSEIGANPCCQLPFWQRSLIHKFANLGLTQDKFASSLELWRWCDRNRNRVYVPEWLFSKWGMKVEDTFSDGTRMLRHLHARHFRAAS